MYFYALDYQREHQRTTGHKLNIGEAIAACYDQWKALTDEEKYVYKNQYDNWRMNYRANPSQPMPNRRQSEKSEDILQKRDIPCEQLKTHYDRFASERTFLAYKYLPLDLGELLSMPIYLINFQIFCKIDPEDGGGYLPAELCILRFTLNDGVTIYRQKFLKINKVPIGYMSACLEQSKETHQIPVSDFAEATDNYREIYSQLKNFVCPTVVNRINENNEQDDRTRRRHLRLAQPCLFFPANEFDQTCSLIDWLQEKAEGVQPTKSTRFVNLISLESLIMVLIELKQQHITREHIQRTFENAAYSYLIDQRCPFHLQIGISHCSVARCHAAAKLLSTYLSQLYVPQRSSPSSSTFEPIISSNHSEESTSDSIASSTQRSILSERRQILLNALQNIEKQMDELDLESK